MLWPENGLLFDSARYDPGMVEGKKNVGGSSFAVGIISPLWLG
jgi:hypothetical protein